MLIIIVTWSVFLFYYFFLRQKKLFELKLKVTSKNYYNLINIAFDFIILNRVSV
jgi:hypothetical protein